MRSKYLLILVVVALAGCGVKQRAIMPGRDPDQVWNAMVAVAQAPDYTSHVDPTMRWTVRVNEVYIDSGANRIEVYRRLERELHLPQQKPRHETREWKFGIFLEQREPPTILFQTRNSGVAAHAWEEADRYFTEVQQFLGPPPELRATQPASTLPADSSPSE